MSMLQDFTFDDIASVKALSVDYAIASIILIPDEITSKMGLRPNRAWARGDRYLGKEWDPERRVTREKWREKTRGLWALRSSDMVNSNVVGEHLESLLQLLEPRGDVIREYLEREKDYRVGFYIRSDVTAEAAGVTLSNKLLMRLCRLSHEVEVRCLFEVRPSEPRVGRT